MENTIIRSDIDEVIFISDIHFGGRASSIEWMDNMTGYFNGFFIPLVKKRISSGKRPCVIIAGDYFDNRQSIDIAVMKSASDVMESISSLCEVFMIVGNHDMYKKEGTDVTSVGMFDRFVSENKVNVIKDVTSLKLSETSNILLVPWNGDYVSESKTLISAGDYYDYVVMHTEISGMKYDNGRDIVGGIRDDSVKCKKLIAGHIHKRQDGKNAMYLGSPYHMNKSDIGNRKGIYILDIKTDKFDFIQNTYSPEFVSINYSDIKSMDDKSIKNLICGNYVYMILSGDETKLDTSKLTERFQKYGIRSIEYVEDRNSKSQDNSAGICLDSTVSISDAFIKYIEVMDICDDEKGKLLDMNEYYTKLATESLK